MLHYLIPHFPLVEIEEFQPPPVLDINLPDRWVAASLLQKGIRRGDSGSAISAARYLSRNSLAGVFRRLNVLAWEDVSFGDPKGCLAVASLGSSSRLRRKLGGDDHCLAWAVYRMAKAPKCRVTDDLVTILEHGASSPKLIGSIARKSESEIRSMVLASDRCQLRRAVAVWLLMGTDRFPSEAMPFRQGSADKFFQNFTGVDLPFGFLKVGAKLSRATNTIFPAIVASLWSEWAEDQPETLETEALIWDNLIDGIPAYVFDGHTAKGSRYLGRLPDQDSELLWWLHAHLPPELHKPALKKFCFRTVSAQCNQRHSWKPAERIRTQAGAVGFQLPQRTFLEGFEIFQAASAKFPIWEVE